MLKYLLINRFEPSGGSERQVHLMAKHGTFDAILTIEKSSSTNNCRLPVYTLFRHVSLLRTGDCIISFSERSNYLNIALKFFLKTTAIVCERTTPSLSFSRGLKRIHMVLIRLFYPRADRIIANSNGVKVDLISMCHIADEKIDVIYNIVENSVSSVHPSLGVDATVATLKKSPYIVTCGRLIEAKGLWHFIRVFAALKKELTSLKFIVLGKGPLGTKLVRFTRSFGLKVYPDTHTIDTADICFIGFQQNPIPFISGARCFAFPSLWEGFPNVLLEALTCKVPVVAADCASGPRELLVPNSHIGQSIEKPMYGQYGILMPCFDRIWRDSQTPLTPTEILWKDTVKKLMQDHTLRARYGVIPHDCLNRFLPGTIIPQWERVIESL